jgi:hypothetical protein
VVLLAETTETRGILSSSGEAFSPNFCLEYVRGMWLGLAWLGLAWLGLAWLGLAWLGLAWLGLAWLGLAWLVCSRSDVWRLHRARR